MINNYILTLSNNRLFVTLSKRLIISIFTYLIATVWLVNGLFCKILNLVPRHQQIVTEILGDEYAFILTKLIGVSEVLLAVLVLISFRSRQLAVFQILIILTMNVLENLIAPHLLLWGRFNLLFAIAFSSFMYWFEFKYKSDVIR